MLHVVVTEAAENDILSILDWSAEHFGESARQRYNALILQSMRDLAANPKRPGVHGLTATAKIFTYHARHSRDQMKRTADRVRDPRHFLLFSVDDGDLIVSRILHDCMDIQRHLPPDEGGAS
jgi:toxin ParE1/3/4